MSKKRPSRPITYDETAIRMQEALEAKRAKLRSQRPPRPVKVQSMKDRRRGCVQIGNY